MTIDELYSKELDPLFRLYAEIVRIYWELRIKSIKEGA